MKQLKPEKIQRISCPAFLKFKNLPACYFLLQAWFSSDLTDIFPNDVMHTGPDWFCYPTSLSVRQHFTDSRILIEITTALVMVISREMGSSDRQPLAGTGRPTTVLEVGDTATRQSAYEYTVGSTCFETQPDIALTSWCCFFCKLKHCCHIKWNTLIAVH